MDIKLKTRLGTVLGQAEEGVQIFKGIPYARPPVNNLRFAAPEPAEPWQGVLDATEFGPAAPQDKGMLMGLKEISDDCLYLNIWSPTGNASASAEKRPVMVWIHGGGYFIGSGSQELYKGQHLAVHGDVVVVNINYRLGVVGYGFLSSVLGHEETFSVNNGLLDQVTALQWVQDNIADYGGDPDNVTIFGESAGGMSVGALLGTPKAKGLFHKAIVQSGSADHVTSPASAQPIAQKFLDNMEVSGPKDFYKLFECSIPELLVGQKACLQLSIDRGIRDNRMPMTGMTMVPVVDGTIIPLRPIDAIREGCVKEIPLMAGSNRDEFNLFLHTPLFGNEGNADKYRTMTDADLLAKFKDSLPQDAERALALYYKANPDDDMSRINAVSAMETDRMFGASTIQLLEAQSQHQKHTYGYELTWQAPGFDGLLGACHVVEVPLMFGLLDGMIGNLFVGNTPEAQALSKNMMSAWAGFARSGTPSAGFEQWGGFTANQPQVMELGARCGLMDSSSSDKKAFWDSVLT
ncbi:MAG: carboxylesterase [Gammaproteobacteria bacterium]|nr:MAG: carboxylesterase [Gammaproteobacteria bacterium]